MPEVTLNVEQTPDALIVHCTGKLVAGATEGFYQQLKPMIGEHKRIVLDLSNLSYMDSMGLGTIIRLFVSARAAGTDLELKNLGDRIKQLFNLAGLMDIFSMCGEHSVRMR